MKKVTDLPKPEVSLRYATPLPSFITDDWVRQQAAPKSRKWQKHVARNLASQYEHWSGQETDDEFAAKITNSLAIVGFADYLRQAARDEKGESPKKALHNPFSFLEIRVLQMRKSTGIKNMPDLLTTLADRGQRQDFCDAAFYFCITAPESVFNAPAVVQLAHRLGEEELAQFITDYNNKEKESGKDKAQMEEASALSFWHKALVGIPEKAQQAREKSPDITIAQHFIDLGKALKNAAAHFQQIQGNRDKPPKVDVEWRVKNILQNDGEGAKSVPEAITSFLDDEIPFKVANRDKLIAQAEKFVVLNQEREALGDKNVYGRMTRLAQSARVKSLEKELLFLANDMTGKIVEAVESHPSFDPDAAEEQTLPDLSDKSTAECWQQTLQEIARMAEPAKDNPPNEAVARNIFNHASFLRTIVDHAKRAEKERAAQQLSARLQEAKALAAAVGDEAAELCDAIDKFSAGKDFDSERFLQKVQELAGLHERRKNAIVQMMAAEESQDSEQVSTLAELVINQKEEIKTLADHIIESFLFPHKAHTEKLLSREELRQLAAETAEKPPPPVADAVPPPVSTPAPVREETAEEKEFKRVESLLAKLLRAKEFAVAQRVSADAQVLFPQASFTFPPEAIFLLAAPLSFCAGGNRFDNGDMQAGEQAVEDLAAAMKNHVYAAPAARLLSFAAALVPAVLVLNYQVRKLFDADSPLLLEEQKENLEPLRAAIYDLGEMPMSLSELGIDAAAAESGLAELQEWHKTRQQKKFKFALATHVWQHWMNADSIHGDLGKIVALLSKPSTVKQGAALAQKYIATYKNNEAAVDDFTDATNQHIHSYTSSKIVGAVRLALRTEVAHAIGLIENALASVVDDGHLQEREWRQKRRQLVESLAAAREQMLAFGDDEPLPMQAARLSFAATAKLLLNKRQEVLSLGEDQVVAKDAALARARLGYFTALPGPSDSREDFFVFVAQAEKQLDAEPATWADNFAQRLQEKDCAAAALLLSAADFSSDKISNTKKMQQALQERTEECRKELLEWQGKLLWLLARADLAVSDKDKLKEEINLAATQDEADFDIAGRRRILARVQQKLWQMDEKTKNSLRQSWEKIRGSKYAESIENWLTQGDFALAERGLEALQNGWAFPLSPLPMRHLENFMNGDYAAGGASLAAAPAEAAIIIKSGKELEGFGFSALSEATRHQRVKWINYWRDIFSSEAVKVTNALYGCLEEICGLEDICIERGRGMAQITYRPLSGLEDKNCTLGHFGSQAAGRWRIVLASPTKTKAAQLAALTEDAPPQEAVLVFCNSALSKQTRVEFMRMNERNNRHAALADWATLFYLCTQAENENIAQAFFAVSLPWAGMNPFINGRAVLPGEIFCGLTRELHAATTLTDSGTRLVYGGRGLGKTTFLQQAQRLATVNDIRAFVLELKGRTKELEQSPGAVWDIIRERIGQTVGAGNGKRWLSDWFEEKSSQRLLLLFDDADDFVRADAAQGGVQMEAFNTLAADFPGRFKAIFAGSFALNHLAQKNEALSALGAPQQVAPPPDRDLGDMTRVLDESFAAAGFVFADANMLLSIAHRLNGNPALMQIFCHHWLAQMRSKTAIPRMITAQDMEYAFADIKLLELLRTALHDTLQGDSRHALAAYTAANSADNGGNLTAQKLYDECCDWHPPAMKDIDADDFNRVLDELSAMNILRQNDDKTWRLRSVEMLSLLGGAMGVEEKLARLTEQDWAEEVSTDLLRRKLPNGTCSALTTRQEVQLLGGEESWRTNVIFGTTAAGRDSMASALRALCNHHDWLFKNCTDEEKDAFSTQLRVFWRQLNTEEKNGVFMVSDIAPWNMEWLDIVAARNASSVHKLRVVFVGGGKKAWDWDAQNHQTPMYLEPMSEGALQNFLSNHSAGREAIVRLMQKTGGFAALINACIDAEQMDEGTLSEKLDGWRITNRNMSDRDLPSALNPLPAAVNSLLTNGGEWTSGNMQKALAHDNSRISAEAVLSWLESLSLAHLADNKYRLNAECAYLFNRGGQ